MSARGTKVAVTDVATEIELRRGAPWDHIRFARRWMLTALTLLCAGAFGHWSVGLIAIGLALLFDLLVTPRALDVRLPNDAVLDAAETGKRLADIEPLPGRSALSICAAAYAAAGGVIALALAGVAELGTGGGPAEHLRTLLGGVALGLTAFATRHGGELALRRSLPVRETASEYDVAFTYILRTEMFFILAFFIPEHRQPQAGAVCTSCMLMLFGALAAFVFRAPTISIFLVLLVATGFCCNLAMVTFAWRVRLLRYRPPEPPVEWKRGPLGFWGTAGLVLLSLLGLGLIAILIWGVVT